MFRNLFGMLSAEQFSSSTNLSLQEVLTGLEAGDIAGIMIKGRWYVHEIPERPFIPGKSQVNRLIRAAVAVEWQDVLETINNRRDAIFKATTLEFGLDIESIRCEAEASRAESRWFDAVIGVVGIFGFIAIINFLISLCKAIFSGDEDIEGGMFVLFCIGIVAFVDYVWRSQALSRARAILVKEEDDELVEGFAQEDEERNVIISGGYNPFVGAGYDVGGWSFTVSLKKRSDERLPVQPMNVCDLYNETEEAFKKLNIPQLTIRDEIYIDGKDVRLADGFMPAGPFNPPIYGMSMSRMAQYIGINDNMVRHYKAIRIRLWNDQVILTIFIRYVIISGALFVEARNFILPPLAPRFLKFKDILRKCTWQDSMNEFLQSMGRSLYIWVPAFVRGLNAISGELAMRKKINFEANRHDVLITPRYNYGWEKSLREIWAGNAYEQYFQSVDIDFYQKLLKEILFEGQLNSLKKRNICSDILEDASTKIYNEGIIVSDGSIKAENITVGRSAQASVNKVVKAGQRRNKPK